MALRVARGLFRLWLVLSVLWIGVWGFVAWQEMPRVGDYKVQMESQTIQRKENEADPGGLPVAPWIAEELAYKAVLYRHLWQISLFAIAPLALVLALGSALIWAFRGFR
jgi:hypothetical protein